MPLAISNINETFAYTPSSNSGSASNSSPQKTDNTRASENPASKELEALRKYCFDRSVPLKGGTLRLVKNWDGSIQLKRRQWYQFWNFVGWGRDTGRAAAYVNSLLKEHDLLKESNKSTNSANSALAAYVQVSSNKVTLQELSIKLLHFSIPQEDASNSPVSSPVSISLPSLETKTVTDQGGRKCQQLDLTSVKNFCSSVGLTVGNQLGAGGMGTVYHASVVGRKEKYVIKLEHQLKMESIINAENLPFGRRDNLAATSPDLAATTVKKLGHITKPIFVIVALQKTPSDSIQYHYLPVTKAKSFVQKMQKECSRAQLAIAGQLMEKVPGNELFSFIHGEIVDGKKVPKIDFIITDKPFQQIAYQLLKSMKVSMESNFIHRDVKPDNIIIKENAKRNYRLKYVDGGFSAQGDDQPLQLHESKGTLQYMSPRVYNANRTKTYGAEADFYSTAMILLQMISPEDFNRVNKTPVTMAGLPNFLEQQNSKFKNQQYKRSNDLESYLDAAGPKSKIAETLQDPKNKQVRELIDLSFQASRGGEKAYEAWKKAFAAWESDLHDKDVIPAEMVESTTSDPYDSQES